MVPNLHDPNWGKIIKGEKIVRLEFLAIKVLIGRLQLRYKKDPTMTNLKNCIAELRKLFVKYQNLPKVKNDIKTIFG